MTDKAFSVIIIAWMPVFLLSLLLGLGIAEAAVVGGLWALLWGLGSAPVDSGQHRRYRAGNHDGRQDKRADEITSGHRTPPPV